MDKPKMAPGYPTDRLCKTVAVYKGTDCFKVNESEVREWLDQGWSTSQPAKPAPKDPPKDPPKTT